MPKKVSNPIKVGVAMAAPSLNVAPEVKAEPIPTINPIITIEDGRKAVANGIIDRDSFEDRFKIPY